MSDDGAIEAHRTMRKRLIRRLLIFGGCILAAMVAVGLVFVNSSWYLANNEGTVGIYQGITGSFMGIPLSHLEETTSVQISDLPDATQQSLAGGLRMGSEEEAKRTVESYRDQIDADKSSAAVTADRTTTSSNTDTADSSSSATKQNGGD